MEKSLNSIAYRIAERLGRQDEHIFIRVLKADAKNLRATLLRRDKYERLHQAVQPLGCLKLIKASPIECCNVKSVCEIYRTELEVPVPIRVKGQIFTYVGDIDMQNPYQQVEFDDIPYYEQNKFTAHLERYVYFNDYIFVFNNKAKVIAVTAPWEDVEVVNKYDCEDGNCYTDDMVFPIPGDMLYDLENMLIQKYRDNIPVKDPEIKVNSN